MYRRRRTAIELEAARQLRLSLDREGQKVRHARHRRGWRQRDLGTRIGLAQPTISQIERGLGGTLSVETWQRLAIGLGLPLRFELGRDALEEPADAGHLAIQELVLRLGRAAGYQRTFELATKPAEPSRSTDVNLRDDIGRRLIRVECVNTFGDIGAAMRSSDRKQAETEAYAIAIGEGRPHAVFCCWVVRATRRNRALLARYPELFASRFMGSSVGWVRTLTAGAAPPPEHGLVWCDVGATRLFEWRARVSR